MKKGRCCGHIDEEWDLLDPVTNRAAAASSFDETDRFDTINLLL